MTIAERDWQAAVDAIDAADQVVITCHLHPDGDALGSALALHGALTKAGRSAVVSFSQPFEVAPQYRFLPGVERLTPPDQVPAEPELLVCFDTGSVGRTPSANGSAALTSAPTPRTAPKRKIANTDFIATKSKDAHRLPQGSIHSAKVEIRRSE